MQSTYVLSFFLSLSLHFVILFLSLFIFLSLSLFASFINSHEVMTIVLIG